MLPFMQPQLNIEINLWDACKSGDKEAFDTIYRRYYPRLYNYGHKFTTENTLIDDSIQEVFTTCWCRREQLGAIRELRSYLFVSFRNQLLKSIKINRDYTRLSSEIHFPLELAADDFLIENECLQEKRQYLQKSLASLTSRQREAIFLKFFEDMTYAEIAGMLGISVKATYKLIGRAIKELREYV